MRLKNFRHGFFGFACNSHHYTTNDAIFTMQSPSAHTHPQISARRLEISARRSEKSAVLADFRSSAARSGGAQRKPALSDERTGFVRFLA
ncbi:MAG: hypothetical protein II338_03960 [Bacteroidaceae bacterium]|nr:hypothetical protein [Bacteroidaceae bacterium]